MKLNNNNNKQKIDDKFKYIINFLNTSNHNKIKNELYNIIQYNKYCPKIIGEGSFGVVKIPEINKTINFQIKNKELKLPVVIKD